VARACIYFFNTDGHPQFAPQTRQPVVFMRHYRECSIHTTGKENRSKILRTSCAPAALTRAMKNKPHASVSSADHFQL
jgi:hypothetical protein